MAHPKRIVLGVSGSVAAYRAADLARELMRRGYEVGVCLTDAAQKFVTKELFEALTGQPTLQDTFEEPVKGRMAHIDWARSAEVLMVAPATANTIAKLAMGVGEDMLTTLALAFNGPLVIAPAMNPTMYAHESTKEAINKLLERGALIVEPEEGEVACGEEGQGKLASIDRIVETVEEISRRSTSYEGRNVLITSGPTQEPIDAVRFLTNRSSGRMGAALARAALMMGARVTVVTGPSVVALPIEASVIRVHTAQEMLNAVLSVAPGADLILGAAAVADFRAANPSETKIRRENTPKTLEMVENPDVIAEAAKVAKPNAKVIGFAAEPGPDQETAKRKLQKKGLWGIAINDVSRADIGFASKYNELTLFTRDGHTATSGRQTKLQCAFWLLEQIERIANAHIPKVVVHKS